MSTNPISVIIPAFNESTRIATVLSLLREIPYIREILVVNDGSSDRTADVVTACQTEDPRIHLISNAENLGKGQSVLLALQQATAPYILMLDADLHGLEARHIDYLCQPVIRGNLDMTVGQFKQGHWASDFSHWITPWLSGQRCIRRDLFMRLNFEASAGYGIETVLSVASRQEKWRSRYIPLFGVSHPPSEIHRGSVRGIFNRIKMYLQILRAWYIATMALHAHRSRQRLR